MINSRQGGIFGLPAKRQRLLLRPAVMSASDHAFWNCGQYTLGIWMGFGEDMAKDWKNRNNFSSNFPNIAKFPVFPKKQTKQQKTAGNFQRSLAWEKRKKGEKEKRGSCVIAIRSVLGKRCSFQIASLVYRTKITASWRNSCEFVFPLCAFCEP